ncbi:6-phosphogluconolactonase [Nocardioides carbamazepini]|uniref:6-phosphogluconolactonase n=1 Tax=Nocardioides carbamazepini TaxID=2854259 RepID=UPI00214A7BA5|nr:6-phosphogluconolactonase [Nocardioides carbamazepini]MCR1782939.1 6-phosphogluconolactonase [Nocardioides carbamazepini]
MNTTPIDSPQPLIEVHDDAGALATAVAGELLNRVADAQAAGQVPHVGLTGGGIADEVHREIARLAPASGVDWGAVVLWFGDERFVPADSRDRNLNQARAAFLDEVGAHRVHTAPSSSEVDSVEESAASYADTIRAQGSGTFDVLMLGLGPDGHVASLFPGHPGLDAAGAPTVAVHGSPKPPPDRVSLTFEALNRAQSVWFVVSGDAKADAVRRALAEVSPAAEPAALRETPARGVTGQAETIWFLDSPAASRI